MKKLLFLLLGMAVAISASAGVKATKVVQFDRNNKVATVNSIARTAVDKKIAQFDRSMTKGEMMVRQAKGKINSTPAPVILKAPNREIPDGYCEVTLTAGDVWGDGSGYQMLLDADATAFGTTIPETGPLATSGDISAETYAEFEYKIPENADGALTTANIVISNSITIQIPAGTYDYCITNPTPGDRMWIASGDFARHDNFEFQAGVSYTFTVTLNEESGNDHVQVTVPNQAYTIPTNLFVTPGSTTADVAWEDTDDSSWNLRYRPYSEAVGTLYDLNLNDYTTQMADWSVQDVDGDGNNWAVYYTDNTQSDLCFGSDSWTSELGALTPENYLISKDIEFTEGTMLEFTMWCASNSWPDNLMVYVYIYGETEDDGAMYYLTEEPLVGTVAHETYSFNLGEFAGQTGFIIFSHEQSDDNMTIFIDDIFIGEEGPAWTYVYGIEDTNYTIEGLTPETQYEVQVQATGDFGETDWTEIVDFWTLAGQTVMKGDVNRDGSVSIADVTTLIDHLLSNDYEDSENFSYANSLINDDETVSIADVTALIDLLLAGGN